MDLKLIVMLLIIITASKPFYPLYLILQFHLLESHVDGYLVKVYCCTIM